MLRTECGRANMGSACNLQGQIDCESQRSKDLLVVWFEKPIMWMGPDKVEATLREFEQFTAELGYKRVLILGAHAFGVFVMNDSDENRKAAPVHAKDNVGGLITIIGRINLYGKLAPI